MSGATRPEMDYTVPASAGQPPTLYACTTDETFDTLSAAYEMDELADKFSQPHTSVHAMPLAYYQPQHNLPPLGSHDTITPSSLDLYQASHTYHDDQCIDRCVGNTASELRQRSQYHQSFASRARQTASVSFPPHFFANQNVYTPPTQQLATAHSGYMSIYPSGSISHAPTPSPAHLAPLPVGNYFHADDLGFSQQRPIADDCTSIGCSQFSCSSQCCSTQPCQEEDCSATQPCQEEDCSGDGTPCNEIGCFDGMELNMPPEWDSQASIVQQQQPQRHQPPPPPLYSDFHDHPCNHTHTEHDVAMTLKNLNNKIGLSSHQQSDFSDAPTISDENQHLVACSDGSLSESLGAHEQLSHSDVSGSTPQPCASVSAQQRCVCKWVMNPGAPVSQQRVCGNICSSNHDLVEHLKTNHIAMMTAKTHIVCSWKGCKRTGDQVFASRNKLTRHLFTHTGYKPFQCSSCPKSFAAQQALEQHERTHTGEMPFVCTYPGCSKAFKQKSALTMHSRVHTGEKPLSCEICGRGFSESSNLSKHKKIHDPKFEYKCPEPVCGRVFFRRDQFRRHLKGRHAIELTGEQLDLCMRSSTSIDGEGAPRLSSEVLSPESLTSGGQTPEGFDYPVIMTPSDGPFF